MDHKHCVFCGKSNLRSDSICDSPNNPFPADTVGNKHCGYPTDNREKARLAAERAQLCAHEITYFSAEPPQEAE